MYAPLCVQVGPYHVGTMGAGGPVHFALPYPHVNPQGQSPQQARAAPGAPGGELGAGIRPCLHCVEPHHDMPNCWKLFPHKRFANTAPKQVKHIGRVRKRGEREKDKIGGLTMCGVGD